MAGYPGKQGRKPKASTIAERNRKRGQASTLKGIPQPPDYLNDEERKIWRETCKSLRDSGLLTNADKDLIALYCTEKYTWIVARRSVGEKLVTAKVEGGDGPAKRKVTPVRNPFLIARERARDSMLRIQSELGMTPTSRSRMPKAEKAEPPKRSVRRHTVDPRELLEALN